MVYLRASSRASSVPTWSDQQFPHPEEAAQRPSRRMGYTRNRWKGGVATPALLPTLRDAALRAAPQGEVPLNAGSAALQSRSSSASHIPSAALESRAPSDEARL